MGTEADLLEGLDWAMGNEMSRRACGVYVFGVQDSTVCASLRGKCPAWIGGWFVWGLFSGVRW